MSAMYGTKQSQIVKFIIQETGTYEDQFRRPYHTSLDARTQRDLLEAVDGKNKITAAAIASVANDFIKPSAQPESQIGIANGWDTKRLRYFLEIQSLDFIGNTTHIYVVGYTDYTGLSLSLSIDPNMVFFINAVNITRTSRVSTPLGNQIHHNLIDASHVLVNDKYDGIGPNYGSNKAFGLRPEDIFNRQSNSDLREGLEDTDFLTDTRLSLTSNAIKSKRSNSIVPVYTSQLLDSFIQTRTSEHYSDMATIRSTAADTVASLSTSKDPFMSFIASRNQFSASNRFTFADLQAFDPNVIHVTTVVPVNSHYSSNLHQRGMTASWGGGDYNTQFATMISQSVPSYMLGFTINKIHLFSTNMDIGGGITTKIANVKSFNENIDITANIQAFIFKLETELLKGLSYNNQLSFQLEMVCDLLGETWIKISINGEPQIDYVCPSFCDSLFVPVVTYSEDVQTSIATDFEYIMTNIHDMNSTKNNGLFTGAI
jgi:hypothetical protein